MTTNKILSRNDYSEKFKKNIITMFLRGRNGRRLVINTISRKARFIIG